MAERPCGRCSEVGNLASSCVQAVAACCRLIWARAAPRAPHAPCVPRAAPAPARLAARRGRQQGCVRGARQRAWTTQGHRWHDNGRSASGCASRASQAPQRAGGARARARTSIRGPHGAPQPRRRGAAGAPGKCTGVVEAGPSRAVVVDFTRAAPLPPSPVVPAATTRLLAPHTPPVLPSPPGAQRAARAVCPQAAAIAPKRCGDVPLLCSGACTRPALRVVVWPRKKDTNKLELPSERRGCQHSRAALTSTLLRR
jgi:hypothetical protein